MTTASEIVTRALKKAGVTAKDEAASASDMSEGIDALNMMIHGWKLRGVDTTHTDLAGGDTFPLASEYEEGTVYLLAEKMAPDYNRPVGFDADDWFRGLQAAYMSIATVTLPTAITRMPSQFWPEPRVRGGSST